MGSCCRGQRVAPPSPSYNSSICTKCGEQLHDLFMNTALYQTRGQMGDATVGVTLNCPKCNTVNRFKVNVRRQIQR